ncbi:DUF3900 domain-containing protein, partial [Bacillus sp. D-CC]
LADTDPNPTVNDEMATTTKNMKSIQYPYMPEEGMVEVGELKIHQASHARYFEDFMFFVVIAISTLRISVDSSEIEATFGSKSHFITKTNGSSKYLRKQNYANT